MGGAKWLLLAGLASAEAFSPFAPVRGLSGLEPRSQICKSDALSLGKSMGARCRESQVEVRMGYLEALNKKNRRKSSFGGKSQKTYLDRINKNSYNPVLLVLAFPFKAVFGVVSFIVNSIAAVFSGLFSLLSSSLLFVWNQVLRRMGRIVGMIGASFTMGILAFFQAGADLFSGAGAKVLGKEAGAGEAVATASATQTLDRVRVAEAIQAGSGNYLEMLESESSQGESQDYSSRVDPSAPPPVYAQAPSWAPAQQQAPASAPSAPSGYLDRISSAGAPQQKSAGGGYLDNL